MKTTKILYIIGGFAVGGKERQLVELINNLDDKKYQQKLVIKENLGYYHELIDKDRCNIINSNWKGYKFKDYINAIKYIKTIISVVNSFKPDFVISFSIEMSYLYVVSSLFFKNQPILINYTIRDAPIYFSKYLKIKRFLYKYFKIVAANSEAGLKTYHQFLNNNRYIINNGLNEKRIPRQTQIELRNELNLDKNSFIVSFVAKQDKRKDHITFFNAVKECITKTKELQFLVVGEGTQSEENRNYARSIGIYDKIIFAGMSKYPMLYLKAADLNILISSSHHGEGIPNTVLESFACGTPVIATDNGGTKEILSNGVNGILIKHSSPTELTDAILFFHNNKSELKKYSENALRTYKDRFTSDIMINNFQNVLLKIKEK